MSQQFPTQRLAFCLFFLYAGVYNVWGQEQETTALSVLRSQTLFVAEEFVQKLRLPQASQLGLKVDGSANTEFTANVFLEVLQKNGFTVSAQEAEVMLEVLVLAQGVSYDDPNLGKWNRLTRTAMEARLRRISSGQLEYLGNADHSKVDVVSHKEDGWWISSEDALLTSSSPGALEKILIPITVIAATIVVVYLFFTVRN